MHVTEDFPRNKLLETMEIVFDNNMFAYGDTFWMQQLLMSKGTTMSVVSATLFFAIKPNKLLLPRCENFIIEYLRKVDIALTPRL